MDIHMIGHVGTWVSLTVLIISAPLGLWWLSFAVK